MGAPKQTLKVESEVGGSLVRLASVPRPHPDLETYLAQATPQAGVCFVKGVGKTVTTSVYGESVQTTFNDLKTQLEGVYGWPRWSTASSPGASGTSRTTTRWPC